VNQASVYYEVSGALIVLAPGLSGFALADQSVIDAMLAQDAEEEAAVERGDFDSATQLSMQTWLAGDGRRLSDMDPGLRERIAVITRDALESSNKLHRTPQLEPGAGPRPGEIHAPRLLMMPRMQRPTATAVG
jgi:hypothetical protein